MRLVASTPNSNLVPEAIRGRLAAISQKSSKVESSPLGYHIRFQGGLRWLSTAIPLCDRNSQ